MFAYPLPVGAAGSGVASGVSDGVYDVGESCGPAAPPSPPSSWQCPLVNWQAKRIATQAKERFIFCTCRANQRHVAITACALLHYPPPLRHSQRRRPKDCVTRERSCLQRVKWLSIKQNYTQQGTFCAEDDSEDPASAKIGQNGGSAREI